MQPWRAEETSENVNMQKVVYGEVLGYGDIIYSLYSIQFIMSMESPHTTWKPVCVSVCAQWNHFQTNPFSFW